MFSSVDCVLYLDQYPAICQKVSDWNHLWIRQRRRWDECTSTGWCSAAKILPAPVGRPTNWCNNRRPSCYCYRFHWQPCSWQLPLHSHSLESWLVSIKFFKNYSTIVKEDLPKRTRRRGAATATMAMRAIMTKALDNLSVRICVGSKKKAVEC